MYSHPQIKRNTFPYRCATPAIIFLVCLGQVLHIMLNSSPPLSWSHNYITRKRD